MSAFTLSKVFWKITNGYIGELKFKFGEDIDEPDMNFDGMQQQEITEGQIISKLEYWKDNSDYSGIKLLNKEGQAIVSIGNTSYTKHSLDIPYGELIGFQVGICSESS